MSLEIVDKQESSSENKELISREVIEDSPFTMIGTEEGFFGVIGQYRITEVSQSKTEIREELNKISWNRIVQVIMLLMDLNSKK